MRKALLVLALVVAFPVVLGACEASDRALVDEFIEEWARSKNMHPIDEEGGVDVVGLGNLVTAALTGRSGDDTVDAILGALGVIENLKQAEEHMTSGTGYLDSGQPSQAAEELDKAIELRPDDWTYRSSRSVAALEQGDLDGFNDQLEEADRARAVTGASESDFLDGAIDDLEDAEDRIGSRGYANGDQCRALYNGLADLYRRRATVNASGEDATMADGYTNQAQLCGS